MDLGKAIVERRVGFMEQVHLSMAQAVINEELYGLDLVRHRMVMKWGVGSSGEARLVELAPQEVQQRWTAQVGKLEQAILAEDVIGVKDLIGGCLRGWALLEHTAISAGHVPYEPLFWTVMVDGAEYRVVRSNEDAAALAAYPGAGADWTCVTMEEMVRAYHVRHTVAMGLVAKPSELVDSGKPMDEEIPW